MCRVVTTNARTYGAYPDSSVFVCNNACQVIARKSLALGVGCEFPPVTTTYSATGGGKPHIAGMVFRYCHNLVVSEALCSRISRKCFAVVAAHATAHAAKPEIAGIIFFYATDRGIQPLLRRVAGHGGIETGYLVLWLR